MPEVLQVIEEQLKAHALRFTRKPVVIGGMAMEYYGMRTSGADIDLVICVYQNKDYAGYQRLHAAAYQHTGGTVWGGRYMDEGRRS